MSKRAIGIETGDKFIKAVELELIGDKTRLLNSVQRETKDKEEIISILWEFLGKEKSPKGMLCSSIPTHLAILRNLRLPFNNVKAINKAIRYEAEPHVPFPIEDVAIDFYVIEKAPDGKGMDILMVAVKEDIISEYINVLNAVSREPKGLTLDSFALLNASFLNPDLLAEGTVSLWINIGTTYTVLNVMHGTNLIFTRGILKGITQPNVEEFALLKREIDYTLLAIPLLKETDISKIVLSGEGSLIKGIDGYFAEKFNTGCLMFNPLEYIEYSNERTPLETGPLWTISIGLALEGIGKARTKIDILKRSSIAERGPFKGIKREVISLSILLLLIAGLSIFNIYLNLYLKKQKRTDIDSQIRKIFLEVIPGVTKIPNPLHQMNEKLNEKTRKSAYFSYLEEGAPSPLTVLYELSMKTPRGLKIDIRDMTIGEEGLRISGKADSYESLERLKRGLASSPYFVNIKDEGAHKDPSSESVDFNLSIRLSKAKG